MSISKFIDSSIIVHKINHLHHLVFTKSSDLEQLVLNVKTNKNVNEMLNEDLKKVKFISKGPPLRFFSRPKNFSNFKYSLSINLSQHLKEPIIYCLHIF